MAARGYVAFWQAGAEAVSSGFGQLEHPNEEGELEDDINIFSEDADALK